MRRAFLLAACAALTACGPGVEGVILDGSTEEPIADAKVTLHSTGWGRRDGDLVWDADKSETTRTDSEGRFVFDRDGGNALEIEVDENRYRTGVCSTAAAYRVGGPYQDLSLKEQRIVSPDGTTDFHATLTGWQDPNRRFEITVQAEFGVAFVAGGGGVPTLPSRLETTWTGGALRCGHLFVRQPDDSIVVVRLGNWATSQNPGERPVALLQTAVIKR